jgi:hypothetical protein
MRRQPGRDADLPGRRRVLFGGSCPAASSFLRFAAMDINNCFRKTLLMDERAVTARARDQRATLDQFLAVVPDEPVERRSRLEKWVWVAIKPITGLKVLLQV